MDVVVGLDIGTTSAKAVAFDAHGAERGSADVPYALSEPEPGYAVQDPAEVADGALRAAHEAIAAAQAGGARVAALSCSSAMHSLIGLDGQDRPLTPVDHVGRHPRLRAGGAAQGRPPGPARAHRNAAAPDGAAGQAGVAARERARTRSPPRGAGWASRSWWCTG